MARRRFVPVLAGLAAALAITALLLAPILEHARRESPDGAFVAVVHTQAINSMISVMPGQGSDKPGRVTLYRGEQNCGSAWLPMVSFVYDLRWRLDASPREADIPLVASWNLDDCSVRVSARWSFT